LRITLFAVGCAALSVVTGCGGSSGNASKINGNYAIQGVLTSGGGHFFGGPLTGSGSSINGTVHILDSNSCTDSTVPVAISGSLGSNFVANLTTATINSQVFTIKANFSADGTTITGGTYSITGGCLNSQGGGITGFLVQPFTGNYSGNFTVTDQLGNPTQQQFAVNANLTQTSNADSNGYYNVSGPITISTACFTAATLKSSQIFGTQIVLTMTGNDQPGSTIMINGNATDASAAVISGTYTITGGNCNSSGLVSLRHS
jgi:hypothetical protein